jgi:hypothetical protein
VSRQSLPVGVNSEQVHKCLRAARTAGGVARKGVSFPYGISLKGLAAGRSCEDAEFGVLALLLDRHSPGLVDP